jgi:carboxylate-amine ligase
MKRSEPEFSLGIEEEYLLVDPETSELVDAPKDFMERCNAELKDQVSPEYLNCQIEIGTSVCKNVTEARHDLKRLRSTIASVAEDFGLAPISASCHPFANWRSQHHTDKERYNILRRDLGGVARRMLICGMHVHVGIADKDLRIDLMNQLSYFLPHLLAMSGSSPFWCGDDTGLNSYRLTIFDNLPRTGLPPKLDGWGSFDRSVDTLIELGTIEDSSKIWWDLRPSSKFPTLETRICDASPRMETTLSLAATIQCLLRMLWRLSRNNQRWRIYENFLLAENRWRAQRYGISEGLIDFGRREIVPFKELLDELIDQLITEDAEALGSVNEVAALRNILENGTSADQQRTVFNSAVAAGASKDIALCAVVHHLIEEFKADL